MGAVLQKASYFKAVHFIKNSYTVKPLGVLYLPHGLFYGHRLSSEFAVHLVSAQPVTSYHYMHTFHTINFWDGCIKDYFI